ncbi:MAG: NPXTG-anchored protein [Ruminococcus sp.]|nr:NPXTG-anchored protein [Ruminococcus sp.]
MKKNAFKSVIAALAVSAVAVSSTAMVAFAGKAAGQEYDLAGLDPNNATVKPTITIETKEVEVSDAGSTVTLNLSVEGAAGKYAPTGLHVQFDSRLKLVQRDGEYAEKGDAGKKLSYTEEKDGDNGFFVTTSADKDSGNDGVLWTFDLQIPADAKAGDVYPVEVAYKSTENAKDLFTNVDQNEEGQLMQAWVFTNGIVQGAIKVNGPTEPPTTESTTTTTESTTTTTEATTTEATTSKAATTTQAATTAAKTTTKAGNSPKTGVQGAGLAVAGLAIAVGTAFALRKKED